MKNKIININKIKQIFILLNIMYNQKIKNNSKINTIKTLDLRAIIKYINLIILILCSVVGAGFVSGSEVYEFFLKYGNISFLGLIIFFIFVYLIIYKIVKDVCYEEKNKNNKINNNLELKNNNYLRIYLKNIITILNVLIISSAMFSGLKYTL